VSDVVAELEALERRGWDALSGDGGADFYRDVMADDGLMVFPGMVLDKPAALETIRSVAPWASYELEDVRVAADGSAGLITYRARARRPAEPEYDAYMSSVYIRRGGSWRLLLHQQSPRS
jgi:hypothetical protein